MTWPFICSQETLWRMQLFCCYRRLRHIPPSHPSARVCGLQNLGFDTFLFFPLRSSLSHRKWKLNMHRLASRCAAWGSGWGPGPDCHGDYLLRIKGTLCTWGHLHCGSSTSVRRRSYMERKGGSHGPGWLLTAGVSSDIADVLGDCVSWDTFLVSKMTSLGKSNLI